MVAYTRWMMRHDKKLDAISQSKWIAKEHVLLKGAGGKGGMVEQGINYDMEC